MCVNGNWTSVCADTQSEKVLLRSICSPLGVPKGNVVLFVYRTQLLTQAQAVIYTGTT